MEVSDTPAKESVTDPSSKVQATKVGVEVEKEQQRIEEHITERGIKRPAQDDAEEDDDDDENDNDNDDNHDNGNNEANGQENIDTESGETPKLSKNQLRKLKRRKLWEEKRIEKRISRKEKRHEKQERKRAEKEKELAAASAEGREPNIANPPKPKPKTSTKVPVAVIIDCQFEEYMMEKEWVSLSNQVTRCYSDNKNAPYAVHMSISSYGGHMKNRYETVLQNQHKKWKDVHFVDGDFMEAARYAKELMSSPSGGRLVDILQPTSEDRPDSLTLLQPTSKKAKKTLPEPEPEAEDVDKSIVYLTADSPYTLERLEPNTCYVIGGIIDKNREKGLCYHVARERNVRTAKLPIGEFMEMQSRHILATNHVMEIMLKWLELGDWGAAFMKVIPQRKGGKLKDEGENSHNTPGGDGDAPEDDVEDGGAKLEPDAQADGTGSAVVVPDAQMQAQPEQKGDEIATTTEVEVEGDNSEEGLQKNALDQQRWSAPPVEAEKVETPCNDGIS
ncbi:tRNA-methyltransferase-domain-containing protein [Camillea tinctor]|nr:tRNA-methyltransferase-domain-containing protein [Camillea tinctor]